MRNLAIHRCYSRNRSRLLKGNFPKKYIEKYAALQKAHKEIDKLIDIDSTAPSLLDATESYKEWLDELIDKYGVVVAPYPDVSAKELVEQSYAAKKPFKESGEGHKDYVVWKTILDLIMCDEMTAPNILLTNNTKDFCDTDENNTPLLHPDLAQQINEPADRPTVYTSIKSAFESVLSPNLEGITLDDIPDLGAQDIDSMAAEFLLEDLPSRSLYGLDGVPFSNEISISSVGNHSIESVALKKVDDEVVITVDGHVEIEVDGFIDKFDYYHIEHEEGKMFVVDGDWNDHVMMVATTVETPFELTIFYSTESGEVTGREISLPEEIEDEWPYK